MRVVASPTAVMGRHGKPRYPKRVCNVLYVKALVRLHSDHTMAGGFPEMPADHGDPGLTDPCRGGTVATARQCWGPPVRQKYGMMSTGS